MKTNLLRRIAAGFMIAAVAISAAGCADTADSGTDSAAVSGTTSDVTEAANAKAIISGNKFMVDG